MPLSTRHWSALAYRDQILLLSTQTQEAQLSIAILSPPATELTFETIDERLEAPSPARS
jgi:hypothetical protein